MYLIDLNSKTVTMINKYTIDSASSYVSDIMEFGENYIVGASLANTAYLLDKNFEEIGKMSYNAVLKGGSFDQPYRINVLT